MKLKTLALVQLAQQARLCSLAVFLRQPKLTFGIPVVLSHSK